MATEVIMPALGLAQETGRLIRWLKREGESVQAGEPLMEIETDKSTVEIEASASGVLAGVCANADDEVTVGTLLAWITAPGEEVPTPAAAPAAPAGPRGSEPVRSGPATREVRDAPPLLGPGGRVAASPLARRLAAERGVQLKPGEGSGPGGAFLASDISNAAQPAEPAADAEGQVSSLRRRMAQHTTMVWTTTPHFYLTREVRGRGLRDMAEGSKRRTGLAVTYTDLIIQTAAAALRRHPEMLEYWSDGGVQRHDGVNVGVAVATLKGLVVVVLHDVTAMSLPQLVAARTELIERAQAGRLRGGDLDGAGITISNLGMYGVDNFQAVLSEGQSSLLAVGRLRDQVVPLEGRIAVEPMMSMTLSCDHRVLDGAQAGTFLADLAELVENPALLLSGGGPQ